MQPLRARRTTGLLLAVGALLGAAVGPAGSADVAAEQDGDTSTTLRLPGRINAPGTWSDDPAPTGPLAAVGLGLRTYPVGLTGERQRLQMFGVSARDGTAGWVRLPGVNLDDHQLTGWFTLSPDGRLLGWARHAWKSHRRVDSVQAQLTGWAVMDTTTGKVREFAAPESGPVRSTLGDLEFSGDSRHLLVSYETADAPQPHDHQFVAFDVDTGAATVLEKPGQRWLPNLGSAATGVVWARDRVVHRHDMETGRRSSRTLPHPVVTASWAPDDTAFAYIGAVGGFKGEWRLFAGPRTGQVRELTLPPDVRARQLLGWRDDRHVVVGHYRRTVHVVDVVTGRVVSHDLAGSGEPMNPPLLAAGLWVNPLADPVPPSGVSDPRVPFLWAGGVGLAALGVTGVLLLRRRRT